MYNQALVLVVLLKLRVAGSFAKRAPRSAFGVTILGSFGRCWYFGGVPRGWEASVCGAGAVVVVGLAAGSLSTPDIDNISQHYFFINLSNLMGSEWVLMHYFYNFTICTHVTHSKKFQKLKNDVFVNVFVTHD